MATEVVDISDALLGGCGGGPRSGAVGGAQRSGPPLRGVDGGAQAIDFVARSEGFELPTLKFEVSTAIHVSFMAQRPIFLVAAIFHSRYLTSRRHPRQLAQARPPAGEDWVDCSKSSNRAVMVR